MEDVGLGMRAVADEGHALWRWSEILLIVEEQLGVSMDDADIFEKQPHTPALTLGNLADFVRRYLPSDPNGEKRSKELVLEAARKVAGENVEMESFNLPILEATSPGRWESR